MRISIIVPVYNERQLLAAQIEHLAEIAASEPLGATEILLVDGGSDDGSDDLLRGSGMRWLTAPRGRAVQMNAGATAAGGDLLLFLHADTRLPAAATRAVRSAVAAGFVGGFFRVRLASQRRLLRLVGLLISLRSRLTGVPTGDQAIFVTRSAFERIDGYAPLPLFEDIDLARRLRRLGPLAAIPEAVHTSPRRWERRGTWRTILSMWALRGLYYLGMPPQRLARYYQAAR